MVFRRSALGVTCVIITYSCVCYAAYAVTFHLIHGAMPYSLWGKLNMFFYNLILSLLVMSHFRAMTCDPGIVSNLPSKEQDYTLRNSDQLKQKVLLYTNVNQERSDGWKLCSKCNAFRPPRAHHCRICGRCIRKMDHHCPWINNCIGELNQKYVLMFLFYVVLAAIYTVTMASAYWILHPPHLGVNIVDTKMLHTAVLLSMCLLFSLFSIAVACDQLLAIRTYNEGVTEQESGCQTSYSIKDSCYEVFGYESNPILWFTPYNFCSRRSIKDYGTARQLLNA